MATKKKTTESGSKPARGGSASNARGSSDDKGTSGSKAARASTASKSADKGSNGGAARAPARGGDDEKPAGSPVLTVRKDLDRDLIETIRAELLKKKLELGSNISTELDEMREAAEGHHLADMDDLGGDAHDEETAYKIIEIESAALDQIDYALDRMAAGTYGVCEVCDRPIAPERLKALPFATLCINCKRQQELGED
jgi:RNA polymerase-binding protein DksA